MLTDQLIKKKFDSDQINFSTDILSALDSDCDLIIELIGGTDIAYELVKGAIEKKINYHSQ